MVGLPDWVVSALYALAVLIVGLVLVWVIPVLWRVVVAIIVLFLAFWALSYILPLLIFP